MYRGIWSYAFRGRHGPSNPYARIRRIRDIARNMVLNIRELERAGVDFSDPCSEDFLTRLPIIGRHRAIRRRQLARR